MSGTDTQASYEVAVVTAEQEFLALRAAWGDLVARCSTATPFQTFEWQWSWWSTIGRNRRLFIVTVREPRGALAAIAPLVISRRRGLRVVELLGTGLSDYLDVIVADSAVDAVDVMFDELLRDSTWDAVLLQTPDTAVANTEAVRRVARDRGLRVDARQYEIAPFLTIVDSWDAFVRSKSKKFRYSLRERLNRFNAADGASIRRVQGHDVNGDLAAALWEVEQHSWKSHAGTAMMQSPAVRDFYRAMLTEFGRRRWANVWLANIGERPVAYVMTFLFGAKTYLYTLSFNAEFNKLAPGMVLLQESIRTAFDDHAAEYDFLCGDESYKERWADDQRRVFQTLVVRPTLRARLGTLIAYRARWALARSDRLRAIRLRLIGWRSRLRRGTSEA